MTNIRTDAAFHTETKMNFSKSQYWPLDVPRGGFSTCGTDPRTDGRMDGRTDPLIKMRGRI